MITATFIGMGIAAAEAIDSFKRTSSSNIGTTSILPVKKFPPLL